ncbi:Histidine kinase-, DNA gyrase B-, and HSP90-like ATPase [Dyella sp. OK004]|uniref:sensor histidine kinase n=1 Tax=Dyella sp. OK004 TaxID=1855292 RepID=UPI0008E9A3CC|nr:sensor histidine kinase [Dyella sp. OK004]SFS00414.1 Histidine kinase-, DNA gyrase B-, and HSP90-like ATPase [Dyella sp. OK004]
MRSSKWNALRNLLGVCLLGLCSYAGAQTSSSTEQFRLTSWTVEHTAPADIWALAQGDDGFLWLGTGTGLYRFDGVKFERYEPAPDEGFRSMDITALSMRPDGSLWIGFFYGGASVLKAGHVTHYTDRNGLPAGMVIAFAEAGDGSLWAASRGGLARFDGRHWQTIGSEWNYPAKRADWVMTDRDGTLWVTTGDQLLFLRKGSRRFENTGERVNQDAILTQAPDGTLWLSDGLHGTRALPGLSAAHPSADPKQAPAETSFVQSKRLLFDRDGHLWGTDAARGGVYRVSSPSRRADGRSLQPADIDGVFNRGNGLPSDVAVPLLEGREGNLWAGTNLGLSSFHLNKVQVPANTKVGPATNSALAASDLGEVWMANGGSLLRAAAQNAEVVSQGLPDIGAALYAPDKTLWVVGYNSLGRMVSGRFVPLELPVASKHVIVQAIASDRQGGLWASLANNGLYHWQQNRWTRIDQGSELDAMTPTALALDASGRLWAGYPDNRVLSIDGATRQLFGPAQGLHVGNIATIDAHAGDLLVGGDGGLARLREGRFESLAIDEPQVLTGVSGIVRTDKGDVWINGSRGVLHINPDAFHKGFDGSGYRAPYELFDYHDGLPGIALQASPVPTAILDALGRIWFNTNQGVAWIDPASLHRNAIAPSVFIQGLSAGDQRYTDLQSLHLPQRTSNVRLDYTATSLAIPDRVRFRYKLDGVDEQWQDSGTRREAFYSNLGPGKYQFHVTAANDDGVWNDQGASIDFSIAPQFYQTSWFRLLCAAAGLLLVAALYLWWLRLMSERLHLRLEERTRERERIARELHDTLLQGVQGLLLRLQALAAGLPADDHRRGTLDAAIEQARDMLVEGRDKIVALRGADQVRGQLTQSIRAIGEELASTYGIPFRVTMTGTEKPLCPPACDEVVEIVREAMRNAFIHANAKLIEIDISYQPQSLRIAVRDDGRGIQTSTIRQGRRDGHWGLVGMHERAEKLGATLTIRRREPSGTDVVLAIPGHVVFNPRLFGRRPAG